MWITLCSLRTAYRVESWLPAYKAVYGSLWVCCSDSAVLLVSAVMSPHFTQHWPVSETEWGSVKWTRKADWFERQNEPINELLLLVCVHVCRTCFSAVFLCVFLCVCTCMFDLVSLWIVWLCLPQVCFSVHTVCVLIEHKACSIRTSNKCGHQHYTE